MNDYQAIIYSMAIIRARESGQANRLNKTIINKQMDKMSLNVRLILACLFEQ